MQEQKLEGEYRYINSRLITNSEEVAFYSGNNKEKLTLLTAYHKLVNFISLNIFMIHKVVKISMDSIEYFYFL